MSDNFGSYDDEEHEHVHHTGGSPGGNCNLFPDQSYDEVNDLEVVGFRGFMHVRCPSASTTPCLCGRRSLHLDSLVVAVDGACRHNGSHHAAKSAFGVFFGPSLPENLALRIPDKPGYAHTSQRAELSAAIFAIAFSRKYIDNGGQWTCDKCPKPCVVTHLVIKSDSAYLVNGMTAHVKKWRENGWRTAKGTEVKNQDLWAMLDHLVCSTIGETGAAVDFWHVPRHQNQDADHLANEGLARNLLP